MNRQEVMRQAAHHYRHGASLAVIAYWLNFQNVRMPSGRSWTPATLSRYLRLTP